MEAPWLQAHGGVAFDLVNTTAAMVSFPAMALVLSRVARFGGHTEDGVYSVAQHSVEGARALLKAGHRDAARAFLIHDGHEYIMGDMPTPIAQALAVHAELTTGNIYAGEVVGTAIRALKTALDAVIHEAAGISWPLPALMRALVKEYDARMCNTERLARMAPSPGDWGPIGTLEPVPGVDTSPWGAAVAQGAFLRALKEFGISC